MKYEITQLKNQIRVIYLNLRINMSNLNKIDVKI